VILTGDAKSIFALCLSSGLVAVTATSHCDEVRGIGRPTVTTSQSKIFDSHARL
jgi:hypothetical protein